MFPEIAPVEAAFPPISKIELPTPEGFLVIYEGNEFRPG